MATEFAWVIERGSSEVSAPEYWTGDFPGFTGWSRDHLEAVRFCRKDDAEKVALRILRKSQVRICEHGWGDGTAEIDTVKRFGERLHKMMQDAAYRINKAREEAGWR